ncbi:hypothetical protein EV649_5003 [Kribbella sp. VKM Ac-2569]|uniref:hypothetical protein n=1 Tax=Kribbella sp. VKM Ac-2569 TaxID=2512220 RepID=UPI0010ED4ABD|nr:hypothetical protein [Kribbella sp. VKM Ac-2569]RZT17461.1 hypothetical protein EV649_5003 [Kribbella sp. VKM Ac-2569]
MSAADWGAHAQRMARFLVQHRHEPAECGVAYAAFKGHDSPLRHGMTITSCLTGGHMIWWTVEAKSERQALGFLPIYVADRSTATRVSEVEIP